MIKSNWDNRFLGMFVALIIVFVLVVSWIIFHENNMTAASTPISAILPTSIQSNTSIQADSSRQSAPAQSPESTKQMYVRMQQPVVVTKLSSAHSLDQNYNIGYEWASEYKISSTEQCKVLSAEYLSGCNAYIEVKNYINNTDTNANALRP